jgi:carboxyl-terminal processing protease
MNHQLRRLWIPALMLLTLGLGLAGGVGLDRQVLDASLPPDTAPSDTAPDFQLMGEAWDLIQKDYVDRTAVQPQFLTYGAISGMVDALGDTGHSRFLSPEMVQQEREATQGQFEGIGAEVQMKDGHVVIVAPIDGSPAQKAGLRPGDIILKVDGVDITGLPLNQVVQRILGPAGTKVTLTILNPASGGTRDVTLVRARITIQNVTWARLPGTTIAHVRIAAFSQGVTKDLQKALTDIQQQGLTGVILDLRDDPGGLLDEAIGVASQFLKGGNVLLEKNAQGQTTPVPVQPGGMATDVPMVMLINAGTASAAEIVAGALQDAQRATLVGETTFGTGTVLSEFSLTDGSALLLATEEWLTPSGRVIWHKGIPPDDVVSLPPTVAPLFPEGEQGMTAAQVQNSEDKQLLKALDLLTQPGGNKSGSNP